MALEFQINLGGNFVEALNKSSAGLKKTEHDTDSASKALEVFEGELGKVKAGALAINFNAFQEGGHFLQFDLAEGASKAFEAIHRVVEEVAELGTEIVKTAGAAEDLNLAVKLDVGDAGAAKVGELAESFRGTRFSTKQIKDSLLPILEESGNAHSEMWDDLVTAATDVATRRNSGAAGAKEALEALNSIELNPQRLRGSLKQLGIKQVEFYADLGNLLGVSAKTAEEQTKAGKIKAETLLSVAVNQIAQREGGALGNATNEGAKTLGATLDRLGNLKENLLEQLAGTRGMKAIQGFLDNFIETMEGPIGTDLVAKISGAFEGLFGDLSGPDGLAKMQQVIGGVISTVEEFVDDLRSAWPDVRAEAEGTIPVLKAIAELLGDSARAAEALEKIGAFTGIGTIINAVGPSEKQKNAKRLDEEDAKDLAAFQRRAQTFEQDEGDFSSIPKLASGGVVSRPTFALIGEAGPEAVVPLDRMGGGASVSIEVGDIYVTTSSADPAESGRAVRVEIMKIIDEAKAAFGAT